MTEASAGSFHDHPRKILFRTKWAKPILKFLHERLKKKLIYLGLPGIKALDIKEWKDYLKIVIAFQCRNYNENTEAEDTEQDELIDYLNTLEAQDVLEDYSLYTGYIEQVVMSGEDDDNNVFNHPDYITVYNLDFCNTLATPFPVADKAGNTKKYYKMDVIDKLLEFERERCKKNEDACFVMFLTVHSHFFEDLVNNIQDVVIQNYIKKNLGGAIDDRRNVRLLKAYSYYYLREHFKKHGFHTEILPTIYYQGTGDHWLLTFTIIGTPVEINEPPISYDQNLKDLLEQKFLFISDAGMSCFTEKKGNITETDFDTDINAILAASHTIQKLLIKAPLAQP
ncbi:MAG: hypothetical protein JWO44_202 [Bacteroidetes bacterium]|nr:hypothetical protein [Bacteroidota bacterium]